MKIIITVILGFLEKIELNELHVSCNEGEFILLRNIKNYDILSEALKFSFDEREPVAIYYHDNSNIVENVFDTYEDTVLKIIPGDKMVVITLRLRPSTVYLSKNNAGYSTISAILKQSMQNKKKIILALNPINDHIETVKIQ